MRCSENNAHPDHLPASENHIRQPVSVRAIHRTLHDFSCAKVARYPTVDARSPTGVVAHYAELYP